MQLILCENALRQIWTRCNEEITQDFSNSDVDASEMLENLE